MIVESMAAKLYVGVICCSYELLFLINTSFPRSFVKMCNLSGLIVYTRKWLEAFNRAHNFISCRKITDINIFSDSSETYC